MLRSLELIQVLVGVLVLLVIVILGARRVFGRPRGLGTSRTGNVLEVMDEVFSPARHLAALELRAQQESGPVTPVPDDWAPHDRDGLNVHGASQRPDAPDTGTALTPRARCWIGPRAGGTPRGTLSGWPPLPLTWR